MGDVAAAWTPSGDTAGAAAGLDAATVTAAPGARGSAPLLRGAHRRACGRQSDALHPGVVAAAEAFAVGAQRRLLSTLPAAAAGRVRVLASLHTDVEALIYNQPLIELQEDDALVLLVHVYLHWRADRFDPGSPDAHLAALQAAAPEYWLKLKRPQAVAEALGLPGAFPDGVTPSALQSSTLAVALAAAPPAAAARYRARGRALEVADANLWPGMNAEAFFKEAEMRFLDPATAGNDAAVRPGPHQCSADGAGEAGGSSQQSWSEGCVMSHSSGGYGENLAQGYRDPVTAIQAWYDEIRSYNFASGSYSSATGHFTQVVWKGSSQLGCGFAPNCGSGALLTCRYSPAGNVMGAFQQNVAPPQ
ncbi:Protein PRY1 [Monoraphidium neglectum]|uniref:Protein PRY1 n=1 Tax=Monoraphidium neglectum TaxID=145388 RepID=A0A0D2JW59_9CHLO|nr:Protein PRY1 [Monoraphidium neglectum]KIZ02968.1 Protein PRY1 [Monoraphidium neglectum]|eukprot:XP_013901987.1 Protein PRY1 [Monoraphidium neglectum]